MFVMWISLELAINLMYIYNKMFKKILRKFTKRKSRIPIVYESEKVENFNCLE